MTPRIRYDRVCAVCCMVHRGPCKGEDASMESGSDIMGGLASVGPDERGRVEMNGAVM